MVKEKGGVGRVGVLRAKTDDGRSRHGMQVHAAASTSMERHIIGGRIWLTAKLHLSSTNNLESIGVGAGETNAMAPGLYKFFFLYMFVVEVYDCLCRT